MSEKITKEYAESGICYPRMTINIRNKACSTTGIVLDQYNKGESVIYDYVVITNKYVWISWTSISGRRVYMSIKDQSTGEKFGDCADVPGGSEGIETIVKEYAESGMCSPNMTINIRNIPCSTTGTVLDQYHQGESVIYDNVVITNKYVWISWIAGSGRRVYMAIKDKATGERLGNCTDVPGESGTPSGAETIVKEYAESGMCSPNMTINIRTIPCSTTGKVLDQYHQGESVIYDYVVITNKYVWISWIAGSGRRVYMAIKDKSTGERFGDCADVSNGSGSSNGSGGSGIGMPGVKKVFIDPGHGGRDPGARGNGLNEKDVVLNVAKKLGSLLNRKGISVKYSRESDVYVDLSERARLANEWGADLFVSIHTNAFDGTAYGTECYTHSRDSFVTKQLSADVASDISSNLGVYNRGHKQADFAVLRLTSMPAILVETAFIDNSGDANMLKNRQDDFASAICTAIVGSVVVPPEPVPTIIEREKIIVSGSENDVGRFKYNFIEPAIKKIREIKKLHNPNKEKITWLIARKKYSATDLENLKDSAKILGVNIEFFSTTDEFTNYLNTGRNNVKITSLIFYSHGYPGWVALGAESSSSSELAFKPSDIPKINKHAFKSVVTEFYSCNTGVPSTPMNTVSFADQWQTHIGGYTKAAMCKTDYNVIFGFGHDQITEHVNKRSYKGYVEDGARFYPELDFDAPTSKRQWKYLP